MGRGLSDLQKTILRLGLEAHEADPKPGADTVTARQMDEPFYGSVSYDEVLLLHWRLPEPHSLREAKEQNGDAATARREWARCRKGPLYCKYGDYGRGERPPTWDLDVRRVALARAVARLKARGLVYTPATWRYRHRGWIKLPRAGIDAARQLKGEVSE
jgi:hypothetical protein